MNLFRYPLCLLFLVSVVTADAEEKEPAFRFLLPIAYNYTSLDEQTVHAPGIGAGFLYGEQDAPFTQVDRRFFGMAMYQPFFFQENPAPKTGRQFHKADLLLDGRIERHQLLLIFKSASDRPVAGGLKTLQAGAAWGYEIIRHDQVSLIIGAALGVSDFGMSLPSGDPWPLLPLPLIRFGLDTRWFDCAFDFLTGPSLSFTLAPEQKIRFSGDLRMDYYRSPGDLIGECTLWYRFFTKRDPQGDFTGIGIGLKNDTADFTLSNSAVETFELQQTSVFAAVDLSLVRVQAGYVFNSRYLVNGEKAASPGKGFNLSVQGMIVF